MNGNALTSVGALSEGAIMDNHARSLEFQAFMRRFFGSFICVYFLSLYSVAVTFALVWDAHCRTCSVDSTFPLTVGTLVALLVLGNGAVVRGRVWGAWLLAVICVVSMLTALSTYGRHPNVYLLASTLLAGLSALLILNGQRYREMRRGLAHYREQRRAARKP